MKKQVSNQKEVNRTWS